MNGNGRVSARARKGKDPWRKAPTSELADQVLPRWFVLTAIVMIPIALAAVVGAFAVFGPDRVPLAARRPPPAGGLTTGVGDFRVGSSEPVSAGGMCPTLGGVQVAGTAADQRALTSGLDALCGVRLDVEVAIRLREFARAGGVLRFAQFQATGVDSTADLQARPPRVLVNAKFARADPTWIAPLVAHEVTFVELDPTLASSALAARKVEAQVCAALFAGGRRPSRGCQDAKALLALPDPLAALRTAGFR
ncbi:MAG: hypothetical protein ACRDZ4_13470 [Egibacteraceae bacterium]